MHTYAATTQWKGQAELTMKDFDNPIPTKKSVVPHSKKMKQSPNGYTHCCPNQSLLALFLCLQIANRMQNENKGR